MEEHPLDQYGPLPIPGTPLTYTRPIHGIVIGLPVSLLAWFGLVFCANLLFESGRADTAGAVGDRAEESTLVAHATACPSRIASRAALLRFGQSARPLE